MSGLPERLALSVPAPCVCLETPLCNQHKAIAAAIRTALDEAVTVALGEPRFGWPIEFEDAARVAKDRIAAAIEALKESPIA